MLQKFCVLGNPIQHSLSPQIHLAFAKAMGIDLSYEKVLIDFEKGSDSNHAANDAFEKCVLNLIKKGYNGANVTVPFKEIAFQMADVLDKSAQNANAANTLRFHSSKVRAFNTDGEGFLKDIQTRLKFEIEGKKVLLLGAGGAAKAIVYPLYKAKPKSFALANRTLEKARTLAKNLPIQVVDFANLKNAPAFDLVINATTSSLTHAEIPLPNFNEGALFYDLFYAPKMQTLFLESAQKAGVKNISDGLGMLIYQAALAFYIWHGKMPMVEAVYEMLRSELDQKK